MRDLKKVLVICQRELADINIPYGVVVDITPNSTALSRWGQCQRFPNGTYAINISSRLLEENAPMESLKSTIIHELLHTCPNCFNHGAAWKEYANKVNQYYGYKVQRADTTKDKNIEYILADQINNAKYVFKCKKCGEYVLRSRASNFTKHPEHYRCSYCKGNFTRIK